MGIAPALGDAVQKILIRCPNWIGDAVMTTPAMGAVRSSFPGAEIVVAANPNVAELLRHHPYVDGVLIFDKNGPHRGIGGFLRFCLLIKEQKCDLAILFQNAIEAALMSFLARIPRRAGYRTDHRGYLLTHPVAVGERERRFHHTEYYLHMLAALGICGGDGRLRLQCTDQEKVWARATLGNGSWVAINPGATFGSAKRWLPERFARVADALANRHGVHTVIVGGPAEVAMGQAVAKAMHTAPLNLAGKTSLRQLMAILDRCRLLVSNDSGPMHVAAALGTAVAAIFGPTDHTTTSPLTPSSRLVRRAVDCSPCLLRDCPSDHRCMSEITVEDVLEAAEDLLGGRV
jgi:heptosyltransferase II